MLQFNNPIILASKSPRRQELLTAMGLTFTVELKEVDESYDPTLNAAEIATYISAKKASAFKGDPAHIIITADTIVAINDEILGKPENRSEAQGMLAKLSGNAHEVYTGVSISHQNQVTSFYDRTEVFCRSLTSTEIDYYIANYNPYDKAGSYGVQDWFGLVAVERIIGSYTNVMGLPTEKLYQYLSKI